MEPRNNQEITEQKQLKAKLQEELFATEDVELDLVELDVISGGIDPSNPLYTSNPDNPILCPQF